jgi:large subunit ribosomal protein L15
MFSLDSLFDTFRPEQTHRRIGRGIGSHRGGHAGRGGKGDSHRSGYRKRYGYEGGQVPLYRKLPIRGFTRGRFLKDTAILNIETIEQYFNHGDTVSKVTLAEKGLILRTDRILGGIKILGKCKTELTKKIIIKADDFHISAQAKVALEKKSIPCNGTFLTK